MKYVFWGTPFFARVILRKLVEENYVPLAVVTNPDQPAGRKKILTPSAVKSFVLDSLFAKDILIFQPEKLDENFINTLGQLGADLFVVVAYGKIIARDVLALPHRGTLGVHPSLLPKYRGASPIQSVLLSGDRETGVSIYMLDEKMDAGPIVRQETMPIDEGETYETLSNRLSDLGARLLLETFQELEKGEARATPQDAKLATYTKKFTTEDGHVDLEKDSPELIYHKIQALNPEPGVWTMQNGKRVKLLKARLKNGELILEIIQIEGKKPRIVS